MARIGICGTFDVENYGDLLFPLIAAHELRQRLNSWDLQCYSYFAKRSAEWPYDVTSLTDLAVTVDQLRGLIVGGGHIIRFDKAIAPNYFPPSKNLHHPLSYWLTPVLLALEQGLPVVWNAPGVYGDIPAWVTPLLTAALAGSKYVAVRDEASRLALAPLASETEISVVPDTVFGIANLRDCKTLSPECSALRERIGLDRPYIVVQATAGLDAVARVLSKHAALFATYHILLLPIGPVLGDAEASVEQAFPTALRIPYWPNPLLLAELIGGAEAVIGISMHLAITSLAYGVPVFRPLQSTHGKYSPLSDFDTVYLFDADAEISSDWLRQKLGKRVPSVAVESANRQLKAHWDSIAEVFAAVPTRNVPVCIREVWQKLPGALESGALWEVKHAQAQQDIDHLHSEVAELRDIKLAQAQQTIDHLHSEIANLRNLQVAQAQQTIDRLHNEVAELRSLQFAQAQQTIDHLHIEAANLRNAQLAQAQQIIDYLHNEVADLRDIKLAQAQQTINNLHSEIADLRNVQLAQAGHTIDRLHNEVTDLRDVQLAHALHAIEHLHIEVTDLRDVQLSQAQHTINHLHTEVTALRNSLSWKLMSPFRTLVNYAQRVRKMHIKSPP